MNRAANRLRRNSPSTQGRSVPVLLIVLLTCLSATIPISFAQELSFPKADKFRAWKPPPEAYAEPVCPGAQPSFDPAYFGQIFEHSGAHQKYHRTGDQALLQADCQYHRYRRLRDQYRICSQWVFAPAAIGDTFHRAAEKGHRHIQAEREKYLESIRTKSVRELQKRFEEETFEQAFGRGDVKVVQSQQLCKCMSLPIRTLLQGRHDFPGHCPNETPP